jgi:DNA invertase Pin-like site-specific DNA recombinase
MGNSLVVRKGTDLAGRSRALRAAQYVRMSTDFQRYSIQNQAAAIAAYAQRKNFSIVRTYVDEGRSGLRIKGRAGLLQLIDDVQSGRADYDHVLVYDVSRWGRFQDVDESAHYEFICKQNGVRVAYCAELCTDRLQSAARLRLVRHSNTLGRSFGEASDAYRQDAPHRTSDGR